MASDDRIVRLGPGGEFDLITRLVGAGGEGTAGAAEALPAAVLLGPGDDAAVLEGGWVVTTDLSVEDVHFRRAWLSDAEIGHRAAAAALSDLAAMAAEPVALLLSIAAPVAGAKAPNAADEAVKAPDLSAIDAAVRGLARAHGAAVVGGDMSRSPGPLVLDVAALGRADRPTLRRGAAPGDELWVTGALGASASAVRLWQRGVAPPEPLRLAFAGPRPRTREARWLAERGAITAAIDLSDGLAGDAGHLAAASSVRVTLEHARVPVSADAVHALGEAAAREAALHGGEDYELCFTARPGTVDADAFHAAHGIALTRVGRVEAGEGVWLREPGGAERRLTRGGHDHWAGARE